MLNPPVPELPVKDVARAQSYYQSLGWQIEWSHPDNTIGAVSKGPATLFFRRRSPPFEPVALWVYCEDVSQCYQQLLAAGARIEKTIEQKPDSLRQFTLVDIDGNLFHFHSH